MQRTHYLWAAVATSLLGITANAQAEDAPVLASGAEVAAAERVDNTEEEDTKDPMAWIGIGPKIGVAGNGKGEFSEGGVTTTIDSRTGFQLSVPINMGGDGFGWVIDPYLNFASVDGVDSAGKAKSIGVTTFGAYTGPTINIHITDPLYVGVGAGLKLGYSKSDAFDFGADIFGRVPVTGTYYIMEDVAAVVELGLGYGMTGYALLPTVDAAGAKVESDLKFGSAMTWDLSAGAPAVGCGAIPGSGRWRYAGVLVSC